MSEHPEIAEHEWFETPYGEFRVEQKRFGTWTSYRKEWRRLSSQDLRGKLSFKERNSTWRVSLLTGQTAEHPKHMMESLEVNYETD